MKELKSHDLCKLVARGFYLREHVVRDALDGVSANLRIGDSLRIQIYQGCQGIYELQGQGRGRPKKNVVIDHEWFTPIWSIDKRENDEWTTITRGSAEAVDAAVVDAISQFLLKFPSIDLPAKLAMQQEIA